MIWHSGVAGRSPLPSCGRFLLSAPIAGQRIGDGNQKETDLVSRQRLDRDRRLCGGLAAPRRRRAADYGAARLSAGVLSDPAGRSRRGAFAQATKQMLETGDYVDIRFQDEVRYKKPVGIYWLQAAVVKAAEASACGRAYHHLALSHSLADRRDRRGAADLLGRARVCLAPRRRAGRLDDGDLDPAGGRSAARQDRCRCCC